MTTRATVRQRAFLTAFRSCGNIKQAAEMANIDPCTHYRWLQASEEYAAAYNGARSYHERRKEAAIRFKSADEYDLVCPMCWAFRDVRSRLKHNPEGDVWECPICQCHVSCPDDNLRAIKEDMLSMRSEPNGLPPWRDTSPHMDEAKTVASTRRLRPGGGSKSGRKRKKGNTRRPMKPATLA